MAVDLSTFGNLRILVVGDLMIDEYVWGSVDRVSPEAPVQIVSVHREEFMLGGAGNVINNLVALGARVSAVGVIGTGKEADRLLAMCRQLGVDTTGIIQESGRPTTRKTRIIAENQHVLRIDRETRSKISKKTMDRLRLLIEKHVPLANIILISDYGKGLITPELLSTLIDTAGRHARATIVDPKGSDFKKYSGVTLITPNKKEAAVASGTDIVDEDSLFLAGTRLQESTGIGKILITCGKEGMVLFDGRTGPYKIRAEARQVYDVSGAGDTVLAVLGLAAASGAALAEAATLANTAAGIVVGKVGTATVSIGELEAAVRAISSDVALKYRSPADMPALVDALRKKNKRIVFTNGCFDLLHAGHIMLFSASRQLGDVLIVAIDDDESVRAVKGPGRPVLRAEARVRILCALESVDYVVIFSGPELPKLLDAVRPDVLTKGDNYDCGEVIGREIIEAHGGQVVRLPVRDDVSASGIIDRIRNGI